MSRKLLTALLFFVSAQCFAAEVTNLECRGTVTQDNAGDKVVMEKTIDVALDHDASIIKITGFWGCLADIGDFARGQCSVSRFKANQTEIEVAGSSEGKDYRGQTTLTLNRYSGRLRASSIAFANPTANAKWTVMMINTEMLCTAKNKLF